MAAISVPTILLEGGLDYKKSERTRVEAGEAGIKPKLRVIQSYTNFAARNARIYIPPHMRVPHDSVITQVHSFSLSSIQNYVTATENLNSWSSSNGKSLPEQVISVEAQNFGERVYAIVTAILALE